MLYLHQWCSEFCCVMLVSLQLNKLTAFDSFTVIQRDFWSTEGMKVCGTLKTSRSTPQVFGSTCSGSFLRRVIVSEPHMQVLAKGIIFVKRFLHMHSADFKEVICSRSFPKYFNHLKLTHRDDGFKQCLWSTWGWWNEAMIKRAKEKIY